MAQPRKTITAVRRAGTSLVAVDLDGRPWRQLPAEVVLGCGLRTGLELDRTRLRRIRSELRRVEALEVATRLLRHRDLAARRLADRLAARGVAPAVRRETLASLSRAGLVDDSRAAAGRARALADRGHGDAAVRWRLEQEGFPEQAIEEALASLVAELDRARVLLEREGPSVRTLRALARRGFSEETLESVAAVADPASPG